MKTNRRFITAALACAVLAPAAAAIFAGDAAAQQVTYRITQRGMLGIMTEAVRAPGTPARERVVMAVVPESPAAQAGIAVGDTIVRVNGLAVTDGVMASPFEAGDTVVLRVRRGGTERDVTLVAAERTQRFEEFTMHALPDSIMRNVVIRMENVRQQMDSLRPPSMILERVQGDSVVVLRFGSDTTQYIRVGPGFRGPLHLDSLRHRVMADSLRARGFRFDTARAWRFGPADSLAFRFEGREGEHVFVRPGDVFAANMVVGLRAVAGAELSELNPGLAAYFGTSEGVLVLNAREGTPAAGAGIRAGDVIVEAGGMEVRSIADLRRAVGQGQGQGQGQGVEVVVVRRGEKVRLRLARPG
jgi:membrane-associated protease RseP (regulator of RpoE activity)